MLPAFMSWRISDKAITISISKVTLGFVLKHHTGNSK